ncbi:MAG TPA: carboxypeptidase-like regulatory domain-containing protein, partial [Hymenobacter sp.]|nr:carboxypeptidase-like regulatory domain-containing protein [Hymenobacter sp.]
MNRSLLYLSLLGLLLFGRIGSTRAQTTQTSIVGIVLENGKTPLPGATVQLRNESTGFSTGTVTNTKGEYSFKELPLGGPYTVRASAVGFGEQKLSGYLLNQGDLIRINLSMQEIG